MIAIFLLLIAIRNEENTVRGNLHKKNIKHLWDHAPRHLDLVSLLNVVQQNSELNVLNVKKNGSGNLEDLQ